MTFTLLPAVDVADGRAVRLIQGQVDPFCATGLPRQRNIARGSVGDLGTNLTLDEPHGPTVGHIDGGQQREGHRRHLIDWSNERSELSEFEELLKGEGVTATVRVPWRNGFVDAGNPDPIATASFSFT